VVRRDLRVVGGEQRHELERVGIELDERRVEEEAAHHLLVLGPARDVVQRVVFSRDVLGERPPRRGSSLEPPRRLRRPASEAAMERGATTSSPAL
jgi:hypothetical protein